jgi:hypothetical protein
MPETMLRFEALIIEIDEGLLDEGPLIYRFGRKEARKRE